MEKKRSLRMLNQNSVIVRGCGAAPHKGMYPQAKEFVPGEEVYVSFGLSGTLGPGKVTARAETLDKWVGYMVSFPLNDYGDTLELGWFDEGDLMPANE